MSSSHDYIQRLSEQLSQIYNAPAETQAQWIREIWCKDAALLKLFEEKSEKDVLRSRLYKDAVKRAKSEIYYKIRQYHNQTDNTDITRQHVSTRERLPHISDFWQKLYPYIPDQASILDVGCGVLPLLWPKEIPAPALYVACDRDRKSIEALQENTRSCEERNWLKPMLWSIEEGWRPVVKQGCAHFDIAFLFKVIPVVQRRKPEDLDILAQVPARLQILSGSRMSMTKKQSIEKRERNILVSYIRKYNKDIRAEFETEDEVFFVVE